MRRIRWVGVITGVGVLLVIAFLLNLFVFSVIDARLYRAFIAAVAGVTAREDALFNTFRGVSHLIAALGAFTWYAGPLVPWLWEPISNPGEVYTRSENLNNLLALSVVFFAVLPCVILVSYVGGKVGRRFRSRTGGGSAA